MSLMCLRFSGMANSAAWIFSDSAWRFFSVFRFSAPDLRPLPLSSSRERSVASFFRPGRCFTNASTRCWSRSSCGWSSALLSGSSSSPKTSRGVSSSSFSFWARVMMYCRASGIEKIDSRISFSPASICLAIATSSSRERSGTPPISCRYMRTGSEVSDAPGVAASASAAGPSSSATQSEASSLSGAVKSAASPSLWSTTSMSISPSMDMTPSISSGDASCLGRFSLISFWVR